MSYENIIFEIQGVVAVVKFNRPKALNALNPALIADLHKAIDEVENNPAIKVLVLTGEGEKAFVAGADISVMKDMDPLQLRQFSLGLHEVGFRLEGLPIPVIACVNGFALGGGTEMALCCDFIYASENAKFGQPEISLGVIPGFGGTQRLPRLIGKAMAKELCMTGAMINAQEAKEIGLVNRVFTADTLWEATMKTANVMASKGKVALRAVKQSMDRGFDLDLRSACSIETDMFGLCAASPDKKEGMGAFLEKRKPDFKGELF